MLKSVYYRVIRPVFESAGTTREGYQTFRVAEWVHVGYARDMEDAKRQFGGAPVLERL
jgi:hypothetical protein